MITDKEIARQILERDFINLYRQLPQIGNRLGINITPMIGLFEDKIMSYADLGIDTLLTLLFGSDNNSDVDEAAEIAKMVTNDKIEEYRRKIREQKEKSESE